MRNLAMSADERDIRAWDGILAFWVVLWLVLGVATSVMIWRLSSLTESATTSGRALDSAGQAFEALGQIPVIGAGPGEFGTQVRTAAATIVDNASRAEGGIHVLAILLGATIALLPVTPVLGFYLPVRLARRRDSREIRAAVRTLGIDDTLADYLARRALLTLSYAEVTEVEGTTGGVRPQDGRSRALAIAELARLGIPAPPAERSAN